MYDASCRRPVRLRRRTATPVAARTSAPSGWSIPASGASSPITWRRSAMSRREGWHDAQVHRAAPLHDRSGLAVLHYAQEIFEGLKAYRLDDGGTALFRPRRMRARFRSSARRHGDARTARGAVPRLGRGAGAGRCATGSRPAKAARSTCAPSCSRAKCSSGVQAVGRISLPRDRLVGRRLFQGRRAAISLWVSHDYTRAAPGGTGAAKCGGNYAASLVAQAEAIRQGCDQVVFLDAVERRWVEELGGMNIFFVFDDGTHRAPRR